MDRSWRSPVGLRILAAVSWLILLLPPPTDAAVGHTAGEGDVSQTGAATYTIPIWSPPGARGIEPRLAVVYNSQSGNGLLGPGWSLSGLSTITRCKKTWAQDGAPASIALTVADRFCLEGARLRLTSLTYGAPDSTYQTEIANFSKVIARGTAGNGPQWFEVWGKDGRIYEYGNTTDSRVLATGTSTPYTWALNKVRDRQGNNMTLSYTQNSGSYVISSISYTQIPATGASYGTGISFGYGPRVPGDILSGFLSAGAITQNSQLTSILVASAGSLQRQYHFAYGTSPTTQRRRLTSIQECGFIPPATEDCLPATTINYQDGQVGVPSILTSAGVNAAPNALDVNGDGRADLIYPIVAGGTATWWVKFATAAGFGTAINTGATSAIAQPALFDDFDGNGRMDMLAPSGGVWFLLKWNGSAFVWASTAQAVDAGAGILNFTTADANGDGLPDLVSFRTDYRLYTRLNTTTGSAVSFAGTATPSLQFDYILGINGNNGRASSVRQMDFNGDGRDDILVTYRTGVFPNINFFNGQLLAQGTSFILGNSFPAVSGRLIPANWNNDACTDLLAGSAMRISDCGSGSASSLGVGAAVLALDWDSDGRTDILSDSGGTLQLYRSNGTSANPPVSTGIATGSANSIWLVLDQNGDGLDDLAFSNATASYATSYGLHQGAGTKPDLATTITDAFGIAFNPGHVSIAQGAHTALTDAPFPAFDYTGPLYVVGQFTASDGIGGTYLKSFQYTGARMNRQGRGFEGFHSKRAVDDRNGIIAYEYYQRAFPNTGRIAELKWHQSDDSTVIQRTVNTFATTTLDATANNQRYFPFLSQTTTDRREVGAPAVNGALISQSSGSYVYDSYGNTTQSTTTTTDKDVASPSYNLSWTVQANNSINNDTANWCLGVPYGSSVSSTLPGGAQQTRTQSAQIDYVNCRVTQESIEPGSTTLQLVTTYTYAANGCGHPTSIEVVGRNPDGSPMPARTITLAYGTRCQAAESITNPLSQVTQRTWNYGLGTLASQTDPNGIVTSWQYDLLGRKTRENRADGTATSWTYNNCSAVSGGCLNANNKLTVIESSLNTSSALIADRWTYTDTLDRPISSKALTLSGVYSRADREYDDLGRLSRESAPCWSTSCAYYWTTFGYDLVGRVTAVSRPVSDSDSTLQTESIFYEGMTVRGVDAQSKQQKRVRNAVAQLARVMDHQGNYQTLSYDAFGNLAQVTDNNGNTLQTGTYNLRGARLTSGDADLGNWTYTSNSLNEVLSQTDANGKTITMTYDPLSRQTSRVEPEGAGSITHTYTWGSSAPDKNIGRLEWMQSSGTGVPSWKETYTYDSLGRVSQTKLAEAGSIDYFVNHGYDASTGFLDSMTYPTSTVSYRLKLKYEYQNGQLLKISDFNAPSTVFWQVMNNAIDARGNVLDERLGNNLRTVRGFDAVTGWVDYIQSGVGGGAGIQNLGYVFDKMGHLTRRQDVRQSLTEDFVYDDLYRLASSTLNGLSNLTLNYNSLGNITNKSDLGAYTYHPSKLHAVQTIAGGGAVQYDANGNTTSVPGFAGMSWYSSNLNKQVDTGTGYSSTFYYGPDGKRFKQVAAFPSGTQTTIYIAGLVEKATQGGVDSWKHYITGPTGPVAVYIRKSSGTPAAMAYYLTRDHLGSTDSITDASGAIQVRLAYDAFGERRKEAGWSAQPLPQADWDAIYAITHRGFTFHEMLDDLGIVHMNGRMHDPVSGRFLSADPFIPDMGLTQSYNRYSYVLNSPLSFWDPSGFEPDMGGILVPGTRCGTDRGGFFATCYDHVDLGALFAAHAGRSGGRGWGGGGRSNALPIATVIVTATRDDVPEDKCWNGEEGTILDGTDGFARAFAADVSDLLLMVGPPGTAAFRPEIDTDVIFGTNNTNKGILGRELAPAALVVAGGAQAGFARFAGARFGLLAESATYRSVSPHMRGFLGLTGNKAVQLDHVFLPQAAGSWNSYLNLTPIAASLNRVMGQSLNPRLGVRAQLQGTLARFGFNGFLGGSAASAAVAGNQVVGPAIVAAATSDCP